MHGCYHCESYVAGLCLGLLSRHRRKILYELQALFRTIPAINYEDPLVEDQLYVVDMLFPRLNQMGGISEESSVHLRILANLDEEAASKPFKQ